jgi:ribosomal protein L12E/L44/L45/RPP1/RPP2
MALACGWVNIPEVLAKAETVSVAAAPAAPAPGEKKDDKTEGKKEEKEEKGVTEEEAAEGLSALFG